MRSVFGNVWRTALVLCLWLASSSFASAAPPYKTFTEDHNRMPVRTQDAYLPAGTIETAGELTFSGPADLFVDAQDRLYVADTGNKRIVETDRNGRVARVYGEGVLQSPTGVFVDEDGAIYVADSGLGQVLKLNRSGEVVQAWERPNSPLYGKNTPFKPLKAAVDKRGNVYIISEGTTNGVVQMSPQGDFLGFFGSNMSKVTLRRILEHTLLTEKQRSMLPKVEPNSPANIAVDRRGLIYTVTQGDEGRSVKRFNISGNNLLPEDMWYDPLYTDLYVSARDNIYAVSQQGFIYEFDTEGNVLFAFGAPDDGRSRNGLLKNASAIAVDSRERIYVADKEKNLIQVYEPTEFADQVHDALELYREGHYVRSQEPWTSVLRKNNLFDLAHKGLGDAYYKRQMYEEAMAEYAIAKDREGYSNAFWEVRNRWLQQNLKYVFAVLLAAFVLWKGLKQLHRRTGVFNAPLAALRRLFQVRLLREVRFVFRFLSNPFDGYYGIREERKTSVWSATALYALFFVEYVLSLYYTGFIFRSVETAELNLVRELLYVFVPFALWVAANYLVSTISDGEGKLAEVYQGTIYAMAPYLVFSPIITAVSNVLTLNEAFVYSFSYQLLTVWCGVLLFMMVKEIHDYTIRETFKNVFITLFTMVILCLVAFIVYVLLDQVYDFLHSVIREMMVRAEH
jgi:DNA-binding beta-propeller fold protein YncE